MSTPDPAIELAELDLDAAAARLDALTDHDATRLLRRLAPARAVAILDHCSAERRARITALAAGADTWLIGQSWPEGSVGRLLEPAPATFPATATAGEVITRLRPIVSHTLVTYVFVVDAQQHLTGVVAFRELAFAQTTQKLADIMVTQPFVLQPETSIIEAMRAVVHRHYPVYPVCDAQGRLLGLVRGAVLFEEQAFEISAQLGATVGVEKEERLGTSWLRSLRLRNPWLQVNLLAGFVTASVVGSFQDVINQVVLLAVFLPVISDQCNNTGCQALAVTLRGLTFGELKAGRGLALLAREAWVGFLNGALTGAVAALAMFALASWQHHAQAFTLAAITFITLAGASVLAG
ncbi:MAG: magnesium transporter, partial [Dokdonella sp.]